MAFCSNLVWLDHIKSFFLNLNNLVCVTKRLQVRERKNDHIIEER